MNAHQQKALRAPKGKPGREGKCANEFGVLLKEQSTAGPASFPEGLGSGGGTSVRLWAQSPSPRGAGEGWVGGFMG